VRGASFAVSPDAGWLASIHARTAVPVKTADAELGFPCVKGDAIFGQDQCSGPPWPHRIGWIMTTALYSATFTVSLMMPDPDDLAESKGEFGDTLRMHKLLRWVHFGGMLAQLALGLIISNNLFDLDRANDYDTLQKLATVHMATGIVTYGALTWAGALMTF